jgi:hypothetical protein
VGWGGGGMQGMHSGGEGEARGSGGRRRAPGLHVAAWWPLSRRCTPPDAGRFRSKCPPMCGLCSRAPSISALQRRWAGGATRPPRRHQHTRRRRQPGERARRAVLGTSQVYVCCSPRHSSTGAGVQPSVRANTPVRAGETPARWCGRARACRVARVVGPTRGPVVYHAGGPVVLTSR